MFAQFDPSINDRSSNGQRVIQFADIWRRTLRPMLVGVRRQEEDLESLSLSLSLSLLTQCICAMCFSHASPLSRVFFLRYAEHKEVKDEPGKKRRPCASVELAKEIASDWLHHTDERACGADAARDVSSETRSRKSRVESARGAPTRATALSLSASDIPFRAGAASGNAARCGEAAAPK